MNQPNEDQSDVEVGASNPRDRLGLPGVVVAVSGFILAGSVPGTLAAAIVGLAWLVAPPFAIATLGAFLLIAVDTSLLSLSLIAAGLALLVIVPAIRAAESQVVIPAILSAGLLTAAGIAWLTASQSVLFAGGVLLCGAGLLGYAIHRYVVVTVERPSVADEVTTDG